MDKPQKKYAPRVVSAVSTSDYHGILINAGITPVVPDCGTPEKVYDAIKKGNPNCVITTTEFLVKHAQTRGEFLRTLASAQPELVTIIIKNKSDEQSLLDAINDGLKDAKHRMLDGDDTDALVENLKKVLGIATVKEQPPPPKPAPAKPAPAPPPPPEPEEEAEEYEDEEDEAEGSTKLGFLLDIWYKVSAIFFDADERRPTLPGWILVGAVAVLILFFTLLPIIRNAGSKGNDANAAAQAIASSAQAPADAENTGSDGQAAQPEPEPTPDPVALAEAGYEAIMETLGAVAAEDVELTDMGGVSVGIIGCSAGYAEDGQAVAVAAYKMQNNGAEPVLFLDACYTYAAQEAVTLTVDDGYLKEEQSGTAESPIGAGQTATIYRAYVLDNETDNITIGAESWDMAGPVIQKKYRTGAGQ